MIAIAARSAPHATQTSELNNGNWIGLTSSFATGDGVTHTVSDVWFRTDAQAGTGAGSTNAALSQSVDSLVSAMATFAPASAATAGAPTLDQQQTCPIMLAVTK